MKLIQQNLVIPLLGRENKAAASYFKGNCFRVIVTTNFFLSNNNINIGAIYLCEQNALFLAYTAKECLLYEFESSDRFEIVPDDQKMLADMVSRSPFAGKSRYVTTTNPISFLKINNDFIVLCDIQESQKPFGKSEYAFETILFTKKNYITRLTNVVNILQAITSHNPPDTTLPMLGETLSQMRVSIILVFVLVGIIMLIPLTVTLIAFIMHFLR